MARTNVKDVEATNTDMAAKAEVAVAVAAQPAQESEGVKDVSAATLVGVTPTATPVTPEAVEVPKADKEDPVSTPMAAEKPVKVATVAAPRVATAANVARGVSVADVAPPVTEDTDLETELSRVLKEVPATHQIEINRIKQYVLDMNPNRPIVGDRGAAHQVTFYRMIQGIINRQEKHFTPLFTALLKIIKANLKGVFHEYNRHRFMEDVTMSVSDRQALLNLTTLLCLVADPKGRAVAVRSIDITKSLESGLTAQGVQRVMDYLNV